MSEETKFQDEVAGAKYKDAVTGTVIFLQNVRAQMDKLGKSVAELARNTNMDRAGLSRLLAGKAGNCSLMVAQKIADELGVPLWKLLKPAKTNGE